MFQDSECDNKNDKEINENKEIKIFYSEIVNISDVMSSVPDTIDSVEPHNPKDDVEMISEDDVFQDATGTTMNAMHDDVDSNRFQRGTDSIKIINKLFLTTKDKNNKTSVKNIPDRVETNIYYDMINAKRGIAVILNHITVKGHSSRSGTNKDLECLYNTLKKLNFDVKSYTDLTKDEVRSVLETVSKENHSDNDCLMVIVMSHGEANYIYASDDKYPSEFLWLPFLGTKCETLIGKPKMFFIQACRGDKVDDGVVMAKFQKKPHTETDSPEADKPINYVIPAMADLLMMYSTFDGHFSFRNPVNGSWFIQTLCEELNMYGDTLDLLTLLTGVNRRIAFEYRSNVPNSDALDAKKQMPCITSTFTKILYFTPKTYKKP